MSPNAKSGDQREAGRDKRQGALRERPRAERDSPEGSVRPRVGPLDRIRGRAGTRERQDPGRIRQEGS